uniref:MSP domain-containing protein n=1 Tax=Rhabditophanes sp. KR3021 TaxID=114890 RepID=A0AC35TTX4_9BILA
MAVLTIEPAAVEVPAAGGTSTHKLTNPGATRIAFKIKSSNNNEYRLKPVFGFVEPGAATDVVVTRLPGAPKEDKLVIYFTDQNVAPETPKPEDVFVATPTGSGNIIVPIKAI